jgi:hypothetical protein
MAPEPILVAYFINPSHQSVCLYVCLLSLLGKGSVKYISSFIARQLLGKHVPAATNTRNNRIIVGRVSLCIYVSLSLLLNNLVKAFPRQRKIVRCVVFYAVRIASKESRRLFLLRTSCFNIFPSLESLIAWFLGRHSFDNRVLICRQEFP